MRVDPNIPSAAAGTSRTAPVNRGWSVGQILLVQVLERIDQGALRISVDGIPTVARTGLDLRPGTELAVRVAALGQQPQLAILPPQTRDTGLSVVVGDALKTVLPAQAPLGEVLQRLSSLPGRADALPAAVTAAIEGLLEDLPALDELAQPPELKRALAGAGTGLEAALAVSLDDPAAALPTRDLKWQLLGLYATIARALPPGATTAQTLHGARPTSPGAFDPGGENAAARTYSSLGARLVGAATAIDGVGMPGAAANRAVADAAEPAPAPHGLHAKDDSRDPSFRGDDAAVRDPLRALAADVEAGIARIATHQLQQATAAERGDFFLQLEIPYREPQGVETFQVELEGRGRQSAGSEEPPLELRLSLPLPPLGEFRAQLAIRGNHLAVTLWSDEPGLRTLMMNRVGELEGSLSGAGFELAPVALRQLEACERLRGLPTGLVDTRV